MKTLCFAVGFVEEVAALTLAFSLGIGARLVRVSRLFFVYVCLSTFWSLYLLKYMSACNCDDPPTIWKQRRKE